MCQPDCTSGASVEVQEEEEKTFKEVKEAFTVLSDPKKETHYGSGQDLDEESMSMGDSDENSIFKAFFSGPGGFSFEASGPWNFLSQFRQLVKGNQNTEKADLINIVIRIVYSLNESISISRMG